MLGVDFICILKQLSLNVSNLDIKRCSQKYLPLIESSPKHIKLITEIHELLFPAVIDPFEFGLCECLQLLQIVCLLLAQVSRLLHTRFDLPRRRLR